MRNFLPVLLLAVYPAFMPAQQGEVIDASVAKTTGFEAHNVIIREFETAVRQFSAQSRALRERSAYREALANRDRDAIQILQRSLVPPIKEAYVKRLEAHADEFAGTEAAALSLCWIARYGRQAGSVRRAARQLLRDHVKSEALVPFVEHSLHLSFMLGADAYRSMLDTVIEKSPHALVQAHAHYVRSKLVSRSERADEASAEDLALASSDLEAVVRLAAGSTLAHRARAPKFQRERLQIGMVVPEIDGVDLDGVGFKLSDYRGKVVVLLFWDDSSSPCRALYSYQRVLVDRLHGAPFAIVGVNSDRDIERLRKRVAEEKLNWRSFWNRPDGTRGPIAAKWNVTTWPLLYVIDHKGVIRAKNKRGKALDAVIEQLLSEIH